MDPRELSRRASEADRLLSEPLLREAIETIISDAKNALVTADASNIHEVQRLQAAALAAGFLESELRRVILAAPEMDEPTVNNDPGVT